MSIKTLEDFLFRVLENANKRGDQEAIKEISIAIIRHKRDPKVFIDIRKF